MDDAKKNVNFFVQKRLLNFLGMDFEKSGTRIRKLYLFALVFSVVSYSVFEIMEMISKIDDFDVVTNIILHLIGFYMGILKMSILFANGDKIKLVFEELENGPLSSIQDEYEEDLVTMCTLKTNKQIKYCFGPLYVVFVLSAIFSMSTRIFNNHDRTKWSLPFTQLTIVDVRQSPFFEIVWFQQTLAFIVATCSYLISEVLITSILAHLCVQCKIVTNRVKTTRSVSAIIGRHVNVYVWAKEIQDAFQTNVLVVFGSDILIICFSAFHASLFPLSDVQCVRDLGIAVSVAVKTLIVCYYGNEVTLESEAITTVCFDAHVEINDLNYQKAMMMMIQKSQRPIQVSAGSFIPISLKTFIWIIKTSYSYFAVLRSRNDAL
ncbi:hypothetical protein FQR65_LT11324 [Abscondita terminalis]|nr:hypothetical protein FQR65_LT11324 [Abscondita terminalis]